MAGSTNHQAVISEPASERTPLLKSHDQEAAQNGTTADSVSQPEELNDPMPDQMSTARLAVILGSAWFGVFLNAVGELHAHFNVDRL